LSQEVIASAQPAHARSWAEIWLAALLHPSVASYTALAREASISASRAYIWVFSAGLIGGAINTLAPFVGQPADRRYVDALLLALIPVSSLMAMGVLAAFAWLTQKVAQLSKATGTYRQLSYVFVAISAPLLIAASILDLIPQTRALLVILYLYWMALYVLAVRAVNQVSSVKAGLAVLAALAILGLAWLGVALLVGYSGVLLP
jgi:hypothetical protein